MPQFTWAAGVADSPEDEIKALYVLRIAQFVEWPQAKLKAGAPIVIGVWGKDGFMARLNRLLPGKTVGGRPLIAVAVAGPAEARNCQVLVVGAELDKRARSILEPLDGAGVLTIGESNRFLSSGGMINLALEDDKVKLEVNLDAQQDSVPLSYRLLKQSRTVHAGGRGGLE
jgi:hypothetical protein